ncbi:fused signal recognition particle receptor [Hydrocarboniphaga daqingensis]|uniref:Signal recognition particle receptor FtsY n=1 Tax=Hydrocarboniphaga daqingensis TaxID=490188 RepID=A0A1M5LJE3_9GAMM|nr:signal recognition particle-docking protein FtsY [Hydrocarboniphaga daqingensis]SHG65157.1 fused signal recognition particle receptor [Hydrocarboniphaga daqingensis]
MADLLSKFRTTLNKGLGGDSWLTKDISTLFSGAALSADALEELETRLLMADAGLEATQWLIDKVRADVDGGRIKTEKQLRDALRKALLELLQPIAKPLKIPAFVRPYILFVVGVNGVGKTTTIGKLAQRFKNDKLSVLLAAGDTFRAAAVQQLTTWAERTGTPILSQGEGADSASVIFDAVQSAKARGIDMVIADTAGRLHTQSHLMEELRKIKRVIQKHDAFAPHEVLLVVDATTGQNALNQAIQFHEAIGLTGIAVTKLDGTAKGGILLAIARRMALPIRYVGLGEAVDDLEVFDAGLYVESLIGGTGA